MSGQEDSGDKTEKPTAKKLRDARKKGDVAKSKDITNTLSLVIWLTLFWLATTHVAMEFAFLFDAVFHQIGQVKSSVDGNGVVALTNMGVLAFRGIALVTIPILLVAGLVGSLGDFLQVGPVFALEKMKLDFTKLNPVSGLKRIFTMDNLFEIGKSMLKILLLIVVTYLVVKVMLPELARLPLGGIGDATTMYHKTMMWLLGITVLVFFFVSFADLGYQHHSFTKKMMMSMRDIRQEMKDDEGDPYIKAKRKQLHQEWSQQNTNQAVKNASVLVVNPTHIAIAIEYGTEAAPIPVVTAKGQDHLVPLMKQIAQEAGVPIMRNVPLARRLNALAELDEYIPQETFEAVAEVLHWAQAVRDGQQSRESGERELAVMN
jgi:type III secretion protein U